MLKPALQLATPHAEFKHAAVPFAAAHTLPQDAQFEALLVRFVSHPLAAMPSQLPRPIAQLDTPHTPATQFGVPPIVEQTVPHMLQLLTSDAVLISQPFVSRPSQFW